ncbi:hypothetical protein N7537_006296 [Penicillium hordei]|uniref:Uncharacterized protein n=1 Tax=Penicillium hordei TaxID=40994 RepID=A0AAD6H4A7_9EURO|nr:uncharacterized protein N7537_006296 [Penicillium hordei]KAJ5603340.1 hypothetical protein N7537_006296 [Penicillium hordei]
MVSHTEDYAYTTTPREVPSAETLANNKNTIYTDHVIVASWNVESGWSVPELKPYGPFSLLPSASCLHYAYECFEGLKDYCGDDGKLRMFRTDRNSHRLLMSAEWISLDHEFPPEIAAQVTHSVPPYMLDFESRSFVPFSATNGAVNDHLFQMLSRASFLNAAGEPQTLPESLDPELQPAQEDNLQSYMEVLTGRQP